MDASLPTGKDTAALRCVSLRRQGKPRVDRGGSSDGYGIKVPKT